MKSAILVVVLFGCTDTAVSSLGAYGSEANIQCFSGGRLIYSGQSTGKVAATTQSDGWEFRERGSNKFVRVSGDCIVKN